MSAIGDFFKSDSGKSAISSGITSLTELGTGLILSNQQKQLMQGQAREQANLVDKQIELEKLKLASSQANLDNQKAGASGNTMLYVGLGIGAVVILGVVIFAVTKKS